MRCHLSTLMGQARYSIQDVHVKPNSREAPLLRFIMIRQHELILIQLKNSALFLIAKYPLF